MILAVSWPGKRIQKTKQTTTKTHSLHFSFGHFFSRHIFTAHESSQKIRNIPAWCSAITAHFAGRLSERIDSQGTYAAASAFVAVSSFALDEKEGYLAGWLDWSCSTDRAGICGGYAIYAPFDDKHWVHFWTKDENRGCREGGSTFHKMKCPAHSTRRGMIPCMRYRWTTNFISTRHAPHEMWRVESASLAADGTGCPVLEDRPTDRATPYINITRPRQQPVDEFLFFWYFFCFCCMLIRWLLTRLFLLRCFNLRLTEVPVKATPDS